MMLGVLFSGLMLIALVFVISYLIQGLCHGDRLFKKGDNPYRRYCKKCGQRQEYYVFSYQPDRGWWEDMGRTFKKACACHKYSTYYS